MKIYEFFNPILTNQIDERLCPYCRAFALDHRAYVIKNHEKNLGSRIDISFKKKLRFIKYMSEICDVIT